jgi:starvation-inducible DNA-binding protein
VEKEEMKKLQEALRVAMADTFVMYFKTHSFHWNIEDKDFPQYHEFFGDLYEDIYGAVDPLAENLRKLGDYSPKSLMDLYDHKTIMEESSIPDLNGMLKATLAANDQVLYSLNKAYTLGEQEKKYGLCNFLADRIDTHEKHGWQLRASLKG